jgi:predicted outer membrane repeat protein
MATGGAISVGDNGGSGELNIFNSLFVGNASAAFVGGAVAVGSYGGSASANISGSTFIRNTAGNHGGAISAGTVGGVAYINVVGSSFFSNQSNASGGAIALGMSGTVVHANLLGLTLFNNTQLGNGTNGIFAGSGAQSVSQFDTKLVVPTVTVATSTLVVVKSASKVVVACAVADCSGTAQLSVLNAKKKSVVAATGTFAINPGSSGVVTLTLTPAGKLLLAKASVKSPIKATLTVAVAGVKSVTKVVSVA